MRFARLAAVVLPLMFVRRMIHAGVSPEGVLASLLWVAAIWILLQPMQMRGAMMHG